MAYYHDLITQKSWQELTKLNKEIDFVLIGGWATYLYTKELKSKDIDILVEYEELGKLRTGYDLSKNDRLKKYEARKEEIQIDVYLPHYSEIGIPVDILIASSMSLEGFKVLKIEWLIVLKIYVLFLRARTPKGEKDLLDLLSLLGKVNNFKDIKKMIHEYRHNDKLSFFLSLLDERTEALELSLNKHQYKKLKEKIKKGFS